MQIFSPILSVLFENSFLYHDTRRAVKMCRVLTAPVNTELTGITINVTSAHI